MRKNRYILRCKCGASTEDIRKNPKAWNGWTAVPSDQAACPKCKETEIAQRPTHQLVELHSSYAGKVIRTLVLQPIQAGR